MTFIPVSHLEEKFVQGILSLGLSFLCPHICCSIFVLFLSHYFHPGRQEASYVNDFVTKMLFFVIGGYQHHWQCARDRPQSFWLTFPLRPAASLIILPVRCFLKTPHFVFHHCSSILPIWTLLPSGTKCSTKDSRNKPSTTKEAHHLEYHRLGILIGLVSPFVLSE